MTTNQTAKHTYPKGTLGRELAGGVFVLGIAGLFCGVLPFGGVFWIGAAAIGLGCLYYAVTIALRASTSWQLTDTALLQYADSAPATWFTHFWTRQIQWQELSAFRLRYFSTRRDHAHGWFELTIGDGATTITLQDTLEGFDAILAAAGQAAEKNQLDLNDTTRANLSRIGKTNRAPSTPGLRARKRVPR